jgi:hypothetical protein
VCASVPSRHRVGGGLSAVRRPNVRPARPPVSPSGRHGLPPPAIAFWRFLSPDTGRGFCGFGGPVTSRDNDGTQEGVRRRMTPRGEEGLVFLYHVHPWHNREKPCDLNVW